MKVLDANTALEFLEIEIERRWHESNVAVPKVRGDTIKEAMELTRGSALYECLELVREAKRKI